jgi:hypothetical protein
MSQQRNDHEPGDYEFRVGQHLDDHWARWFGDLTLTREAGGTTTLRGIVPDQAALRAILTRFRDLGMTLISVRAMSPTDSIHQQGEPQ